MFSFKIIIVKIVDKRSLYTYYFYYHEFRRNYVSLSNRTAVKIHWGKYGVFYWFPVMTVSSPYLLKIDACCPSPLLHACPWLTLKMIWSRVTVRM